MEISKSDSFVDLKTHQKLFKRILVHKLIKLWSWVNFRNSEVKVKNFMYEPASHITFRDKIKPSKKNSNLGLYGGEFSKENVSYKNDTEEKQSWGWKQ